LPLQLGIEMHQTQIGFLLYNFFYKKKNIVTKYFVFPKHFLSNAKFHTKKKTCSQNFIKKSQVPFECDQPFFLLERFRTKKKFKTEKRNSSDFEVFNCKISMENIINDQYVAKG
jgi:hypothetical protein